MASLLSKFRIDYSDLKVIPNISNAADQKTKSFFDLLIADYQSRSRSSDNGIHLINLLIIAIRK